MIFRHLVKQQNCSARSQPDQNAGFSFAFAATGRSLENVERRNRILKASTTADPLTDR